MAISETHQSIQQLHEVVKQYPLLTKTDEIELAKRIERGDLDAKERMINSNLRLVMWQAKRYHNKFLTFDDIFQEGTIGLIRAVEKFDYRKGFKFSTYAVLWIRQSILRAIDNKTHGSRITVDDAALLRHMKRDLEQFGHDHGRDPTDAEVLKMAKKRNRSGQRKDATITLERIADIYRASGSYISLNKMIADYGSAEVGDFLPAKTPGPDDEVIDEDKKTYIRKVISTLPEVERNILVLRYGLDGGDGQPFYKIEQMLGMGSDTVRKHYKNAHDRLRTHEGLATVSTEEAFARVAWGKGSTSYTKQHLKRASATHTLCGIEVPINAAEEPFEGECGNCQKILEAS